MRPTLTGVLETALYVEDLDRSQVFYEHLFGFEVLSRIDRMCALAVAGQHVLLLFKRGASTEPTVTPRGVVPPTDGGGELHLAFAIPRESLEGWQSWLARNDVEVESTMRWENGGQSLYFRDPDRHVIELATPGTWAIY